MHSVFRKSKTDELKHPLVDKVFNYDLTKLKKD